MRIEKLINCFVHALKPKRQETRMLSFEIVWKKTEKKNVSVYHAVVVVFVLADCAQRLAAAACGSLYLAQHVIGGRLGMR